VISYDSRWIVGDFFILISYDWLIKYFCIQQYILVSVKFCASSRGYTLEAFECVWLCSYIILYGWYCFLWFLGEIFIFVVYRL